VVVRRAGDPAGNAGITRCPSCGRRNRSERRFCAACGGRLPLPCAACGWANEPGEKFCGSCGVRLAGDLGSAPAPVRPDPSPATYTPEHLAEKIFTARAALEGERKQVTVLFADVKGSMELAEQVDPETWHGIMDRFFTILAEGVHRFEGTVNQYIGDGIMALFGAPIAHEDHARRACWAALHLADELRRYAEELKRTEGLGFSVRIGINSGEVVVGRIGDDLRMEYTAQGHTVGLAARMEQLADPGRVYLTEHTARLIDGWFRLRDLGAFVVKGVRQPLRVFELEGVGPLRTRLDVSRARGFSRFLARQDEMMSLEAALERARSGNGQVVGVVAEPGVGKSRLCYEFAQRCRARGFAVTEVHAVAHAKSIPFFTLLEYVRAYFDIGEQDAARAVQEKVAGRILLLDPGLTDALALLFDLLGVPDADRPAAPMDPEVRQRQLFAALRRLIHAASRRAPRVSVIEDLHWIDDGTEAFLADWIEALAGTHDLLVVNFRPEYRAAWMEKPDYRQVPLLPLPREATAELLRDLLGADPSLDALAERITERTGGNPFFVEEVVQVLVDTGRLEGAKGAYRLVGPVHEVTIPATVQAVLAARIDGLGEREKMVLQTAAVIGKEFAEPVLARVAALPATELGAALRVLMQGEFVYQEALFPEAEYAFKHPLTQEVAYRSQLGGSRAHVHAAVARAIAALHPDKLDEQAALLAHHWEAAGEALEAAHWYRRAAGRAGLADLAAAIAHWRKVRALLAPLPEVRETMELRILAATRLLNFGWRRGVSEDEAAAIFSEGMALALRAGDARAPIGLLNSYGILCGFAGDVERAVEYVTEGTRLAEQTDDPGLQVASRVSLVEAQLMAGEHRAALGTIEEALAKARAAPPRAFGEAYLDPAIWLTMMRGWILFEMGRLEEGEVEIDRAGVLAREHGQEEILGWTAEFGVYLAEFRGDVRTALERARGAVEIAEKIGSSLSRCSALLGLACALVASQDWRPAIDTLEQALAIVRERRTGLHWEALMLAKLAEARLGSGDADRAAEAAEEAVRLARARSTKVTECRARLVLAQVLLQRDGARAREPIAAALDRALALVAESGARLYEPFIRVELAALARLSGDEAARQRELREAQRLFTEMGATARAERVASDFA